MNVATKPAKHSAPGQYLGFALQSVRLCFHLLTCPKGAKVSLEFLDDVAVHLLDGSTLLEQTKSALKQNPISDWADDFWKAIANWLDSISAGGFDSAKAQFQLYVTPAKTGKLAQEINEAKNAAQVAAIFASIKTKLRKLKQPPGCMPFLQQFIDVSDEQRFAVISRMAVISTDNDPIEPLRALIALTVSPEIVDVLCQAAIGMAKEQADDLIRNGALAIIDADKFKSAFRTFVQSNNLPGYLNSLGGPPTPGAVADILSSRPTFIRQLELIAVPEDDRVRAVSDFLRTSADKTSWAEQGLIFDQSLRDWDDSLLQHHGLISGEVTDMHGDKEAVVRGRNVYRRCRQVQAPLGGRVVPGHFVHGCYNSLADNKMLGWHPEYEQLLDGEEI